MNAPPELQLVLQRTISALSKGKTELHSQSATPAKEKVWVAAMLTVQRELLWLRPFVVTG